MRNRTLIAVALADLSFLSGCGSVGSYELGGEQMLTLDQAIARASDTRDLWVLLSQASQLDRPNDKIIIERELLSMSSKQDPATLESLSRCASSEEIRNAAADALREHEQAQEEKAKREREEQQIQAQKHAEEIRLARKESRQRLIHEARGRLDDKSAEQVKRLVDEWAKTPTLVDESWSDPQLFGTTDFYKAFGQPRRKQLIGSHYYFYYDCEDGLVQIEIDAGFLDKAGCIIVLDLNIL
ncbi:MAG: hypothetical protein M1376_07290 [Planctomycetes bacterium]|nr:hypothetical protein [Planctomycetota bacterium]